jgi:uncharacterized membrane protein
VAASLHARWRNALYGFWLVPGAIVVAFGALALLLIAIDRGLETGDVDALFGGDAEAAREVLSTVGMAIATIAGVVFSITVVTLQLVSSQFTPRALRTFLSDRVTQVTAGVFVGTFVYCLLVLRTVRDDDEGVGGFVPALSVTVSYVLGIAGLVLLLVFIHHVASSVQVSSIAARLARDTLAAMGRLYPEPYGDPEDDESAAELAEAWRSDDPEPVVAHPERPGYVQSVGLDDLVEAIGSQGVRLHVMARPGDFVTERTPLVAVWGVEGADRARVVAAVQRSVTVAGEREITEDAAFGLRQLADIAVRALSPSLNDPTTALTCIGYLQAAIERLAGRTLPRPSRRFENGTQALVERRTFADHVDDAFLDVGRHAAREQRVAGAVLAALAAAAEAAAAARAHGRVAHLVETAERIGELTLLETSAEADRERIERAVSAVGEASAAATEG